MCSPSRASLSSSSLSTCAARRRCFSESRRSRWIPAASASYRHSSASRPSAAVASPSMSGLRWVTVALAGVDGRSRRLEQRIAEHEPVRPRVDLDPPAVAELPEEHLVGEHALDLRLDQARHRPGAEGLVVAALGEPAPRSGRELDGHAAGEELRIELDAQLLARRV